MKKIIQTALTLLFLLPLGLQAQSVVTKDLYEGTQILNSDFEDFHTVNANDKEYIEPDYWHSFATAQGSYAYLTKQDLEQMKGENDKRPQSNGVSSVAIRSTKILGFVANATLTTGRMNAGALSASHINNHAFMEVSDAEDDAHFPFYAKLIERPTAISVWLKFTPASGTPNASLSAVITNGKRYQEPKDQAYTDVIVGEAKTSEIKASTEWQHLVIPFTYNGFIGGDPEAIMVTLSTNATPGAGTAGDELLIDDLELIYTQSVDIPKSGYQTFTNVAMEKHNVKMPKGLKGYVLGKGAGNNPIVIKTYVAGDIVPAGASLLLEADSDLLEGNADNPIFETTLYDTCDNLELVEDFKLVPASELNNPVDGYKYFYLANQLFSEATVAPDDIQKDKALLRVKKDIAAESYQHILFTPEKKGDINDDGQATIADITSLVNRLHGIDDQSNKLLIPSADVNGDGSVTNADVTYLVNILLGKITE